MKEDLYDDLYLEEKEELQRFIPSITVAFEGKNEEKINFNIIIFIITCYS